MTQVLGAALGVVLGSLGPVYVLTQRWSSPLDENMAAAMVVVAPVLGWVFAREAASPRLANGLRAVLWVTVTSVLFGSFLTAAIGVARIGGSTESVIMGTLGLWLAGLLILGIPALLPALVLALVWVAALRVVLSIVIRKRDPGDVPAR